MYLNTYAKYLTCNTKVKQKDFFAKLYQTLFLLPSEPCCFDVKNVFRQSKMLAIKTLTDTNRIFKKGYYMLIVISTQSNHIWAPLDNQTPFLCLIIILST